MLKKTAILMAFITLAMFGLATSAQARDWDHDRDRDHDRGRYRGHFYVHHPYPRYGGVYVSLPGSYFSVTVGGLPYYYCDGVYYRRYYDSYVVVPTPIGAVIETLPGGYRTVYVSGYPYYYCDGVYYRQVSTGYEVVPEPRVQSVVNGEKLGISDIIVLSRNGISDDAIIAKIVDTGSVFRLSVEEVETLRRSGVSSRVVNYMLSNRR